MTAVKIEKKFLMKKLESDELKKQLHALLVEFVMFSIALVSDLTENNIELQSETAKVFLIFVNLFIK